MGYNEIKYSLKEKLATNPPLLLFPYQQSCVVCGVWSVVCGVWSVVCGVWCVECGVWSVVCGVWSVVSNPANILYFNYQYNEHFLPRRDFVNICFKSLNRS